MAYRTLKVSTAGAVMTVAVDRPDALNALNNTVWSELLDAFANAQADDTIRALLLVSASPKSFVAGADIKEFTALDGVGARERSARIMGNYDRLRRLAKPSVAAIEGWCLGGGMELALACDVRVASRTARFGYPEIKLGIFPGTGGTVLLAKLIGAAAAREICLLGEIIDAERAYGLGLVGRVVEPDALAATGRALAERLASFSPVALRECKRVLDAVLDDDMAAHRHTELDAYRTAFESEDRQEGVAAFIAKRSPSFTGR
jgi:enoyl-CoA hydratase